MRGLTHLADGIRRTLSSESVDDAHRRRQYRHLADGARPATVEDMHEIARSLPGVTTAEDRATPTRRVPLVNEVSRRSFIFVRNPRPDAVDPETGERYPDAIGFWVADELEKEAILADSSLPFFTTPHFDGHPSVLVRAARLGELTRDELEGFVERAWLSRAGPRLVARWTAERGTEEAGPRAG